MGINITTKIVEGLYIEYFKNNPSIDFKKKMDEFLTQISIYYLKHFKYIHKQVESGNLAYLKSGGVNKTDAKYTELLKIQVTDYIGIGEKLLSEFIEEEAEQPIVIIHFKDNNYVYNRTSFNTLLVICYECIEIGTFINNYDQTRYYNINRINSNILSIILADDIDFLLAQNYDITLLDLNTPTRQVASIVEDNYIQWHKREKEQGIIIDSAVSNVPTINCQIGHAYYINKL